MAELPPPSASYDFKYEINGNQLYIDFINESAHDSTYSFTVQNNTLTLVGGNDTAVVKYGNTWYYVKNGTMNSSNTLVKYGNTWYHVNGGKWVKDTTLVKYGSKWYYVQKGVVNFKTNTKVKYGGKWYTVSNGVVK